MRAASEDRRRGLSAGGQSYNMQSQQTQLSFLKSYWHWETAGFTKNPEIARAQCPVPAKNRCMYLHGQGVWTPPPRASCGCQPVEPENFGFPNMTHSIHES